MDFIRMQAAFVAHGWYEKKWSVDTEGWIWYGVGKAPSFTRLLMDSLFSIQDPWSCCSQKPSAIRRPKYPASPPTVIRAKGSHIPPSSHCPTSAHSNHTEPVYIPVELQVAPTSFKISNPKPRRFPKLYIQSKRRIAF